VTLEFLVAWGGNRTHYVPKPIIKSKEEEVLLVMQRIEPDPVEELAEPSPQSEPPEGPAPPMLQDIPQAITPQSFIQQIEPPPPPLTDFSKSIMKIPGNRTSFGKVEILDISQLDKSPIPKFRARPAYPFEMVREGISGEVFVDFIVDPNGNVRNAFVLRSSRPEFEESAVRAVSKWTFIPGQKNNHAVYTHMQVPIRFNIEKTQGGD
jgi:protein TonB